MLNMKRAREIIKTDGLPPKAAKAPTQRLPPKRPSPKRPSLKREHT
jgi:hypothetical protein